MMRTMGNSPAVLNGYLSFSGALSESRIGGKLGELIAVAVANVNGCAYCDAAHHYIGGKLLHIEGAALTLARNGRSGDPRTEAALQFARRLVETRGRVSEAELASLRQAGYDDGTIAEIIAHTALNVFTNYFNNASDVVLDFPAVAETGPVLN